MNIHRSRRAVFPSVFVWLAMSASGAVFAAAQVTPLGEPDKYGATNYSVQCDSGARKIVQCVRDDQHCGYAGDQALEIIVESLCAAAVADLPSAEAPSMETAPASP